MRRLWTLQEGILGTRRLYALFKNRVFDVQKGLESYSMVSFARRFSFNEAAGAQESERIVWLWSDLKWRSTSHIEDEVIVSANFLAVKGASLWNFDPKSRIKKLLSLLHRFFRRIILLKGQGQT